MRGFPRVRCSAIANPVWHWCGTGTDFGLFQQSQCSLEPERRRPEMVGGGGDVRVAEEVTDVVQLRARLEQPTGELTPQVVEVETDDPGSFARRPPRSPHGTDTVAHFGTEHKCLRPQLLASRIVPKHLENGTESLTDWDHSRLASLCLCFLENEPVVALPLVDMHVAPLQVQ